MLVLSRRKGENLIIGDNIVVSILGISGNQVRLGVAAPKEISVHREEIYNKIQLSKYPVAQGVWQDGEKVVG
ncbi:carbon storage regulator CsrA [Oceanicoccus sagamiensis]|uniref:Translational regulator CsrA n=1 Tax=Oceanicoccus sagamiensis TaxID=716816 RepID=A0A1X9NB64_9GAMM|nr:carbon storage regulator CsrA [Oceanicoccus sagamiensis]ARN74284.1 carbon storage regulator [Oceanicoccus sagamiensis]